MKTMSIAGRRVISAAKDVVAGEARLVLALGAFDTADAGAAYGFDSTAAWLAWRTEMAPGTAREYVRIARALRRLPAIAAALEEGRVRFSRVRAITRVARPDDQERWLELAASHSAAELETIVRDLRAATMLADPAMQTAQRSLRTRSAPGGMLGVEALLAAVDGAIVERALLKAGRALPATAETDPELSGAPLADRRRADALVEMARAYLAGSPGKSDNSERFALLVHLDGLTGAARLHDGPALPPETFAPILSRAKVYLTDAEGLVRLAPKRISRALRRAMLLERPCCAYPGCNNRVWIDIHHKVHQAHGGGHRKENLMPLCSQHHRAAHQLGLRFSCDAEGRFQVHRPDGALIRELPDDMETEGVEMVS